MLGNSNEIAAGASPNQRGYQFHLANGQGWYLTATEDLWPWTQQLAAIMQLKTSNPNGYPKLSFVPKQSDENKGEEPLSRLETSIKEQLAGLHWKVRDIGDARFWSRLDGSEVICEMATGDERLDILMMRCSLYPIYQTAHDAGGLPFHAGLIERDGIGILLAAPAGTGKSTCCRRLPSPWRARCDDETLIVRDEKKRYLAHPFPTWSDHLPERSQRTWNVEAYVPLSAIFFLEQADLDEVVPIGQGEAAMHIVGSVGHVHRRTLCYLDREEAKSLRIKSFKNACEVAKSIPAFKLRVSLKGRFWEKIEEAL